MKRRRSNVMRSLVLLLALLSKGALAEEESSAGMAVPSPGAGARTTPDEKGAESATSSVDALFTDGQESPLASLAKEFRELLNRPGGLTAEEAASEAARYSLDARLAQEDLKSADAQVTKTVYNYAPRLSLTASYTRRSVQSAADSAFGSGSLVGTTEPAGPLGAGAPLFALPSDALNFAGVPNYYYLNAGITIPISDYLLNMSQAFAGVNAAKKTAEINERAGRVNAAANARLMYYEWALAKLRSAEAEKAISRANTQLASLNTLFSAGRVARAEVLRQDAFVASTELTLRRTRVQESIAQQNLYALMTGGVGQLPAWSIGEDVLTERPGDSISTAQMEKFHDEAVAHRLEIKALENTVYALKQKSSVQRTRGYPRLEGFGNVTYANPNQNFFPTANEWNPSWDLGIRLTWTVNDLGANAADARVTDAETAQVRTQKRQLSDRLRTEVLTSARTMEEAYLARGSARRGLVAAEAAYGDLTQLFRHGRATTLDVLQSESALLRSRMDLIEAYIALRTARVRFDHALGRDLKK